MNVLLLHWYDWLDIVRTLVLTALAIIIFIGLRRNRAQRTEIRALTAISERIVQMADQSQHLLKENTKMTVEAANASATAVTTANHVNEKIMQMYDRVIRADLHTPVSQAILDEAPRVVCYGKLRDAMRRLVENYYRTFPERYAEERLQADVDWKAHYLQEIFTILDGYVIGFKKPELSVKE